MEPRVNVITLAVDDLERALVFHRDGLGLQTKGVPWGIYSGYFRDPDGHLWEIIWNPGHRSEAD